MTEKSREELTGAYVSAAQAYGSVVEIIGCHNGEKFPAGTIGDAHQKGRFVVNYVIGDGENPQTIELVNIPGKLARNMGLLRSVESFLYGEYLAAKGRMERRGWKLPSC